MSIKEAQEWLDEQPGVYQPLYAVMVELDGDGEYQLIWIDMGHLGTTNLLPDAAWFGYDIALDIAQKSIGELLRFDDEEREITRAFIVKKAEGCLVIEEVKADEH